MPESIDPEAIAAFTAMMNDLAEALRRGFVEFERALTATAEAIERGLGVDPLFLRLHSEPPSIEGMSFDMVIVDDPPLREVQGESYARGGITFASPVDEVLWHAVAPLTVDEYRRFVALPGDGFDDGRSGRDWLVDRYAGYEERIYPEDVEPSGDGFLLEDLLDPGALELFRKKHGLDA